MSHGTTIFGIHDGFDHGLLFGMAILILILIGLIIVMEHERREERKRIYGRPPTHRKDRP